MFLSYQKKVIISVICSGLWIYFRNQQCYTLIPTHSLFAVIFIMIWSYLNYYEPLFLPLGLFILFFYGNYYNIK